MQTKSEYEKVMQLSGEAFNEYVNENSKLKSSEQQNDLISAIVLHCPAHEMYKLQLLIDNAASLSGESSASDEPILDTKAYLGDEVSAEDDSLFLSKLRTAFALKKDLLSLSDANMYTPHRILLDLDKDCVNEFKQLACSLLAGNESTVVDNLAKKTPSSDRSKVASIIHHLFPNSILATQVCAAFEIRREQEKTLDKFVMLSEESAVSQPATDDAKPSVGLNSNAFFTQSEVRNRYIDTVTSTEEEAVPKKFNLLHSDDAEESSCCEKLCTLF